MEVIKTVRVPVHYALTKRKLCVLNRLTARLTYCVYLFSKLIEERSLDAGGYGEFTKHDVKEIGRITKLSSAYVQQCRDQALWMWRSHHAQQEEWKCRVKHAEGKWLEKLFNREPQAPLHKGIVRKVPIRIDHRTGRVETSKRMKLSPYVLRISTLEKNRRITIPLNPAKYHLELLRNGKAADLQLVKTNDWFYAHICIKYDMPELPVHAVLGVDLGIRRAMATVLLNPNQPLRRENLTILTDGEKKHRLDCLNRRIAKLQRAKKWSALKRLRHKRRNISESLDRLNAIKIAKSAEQEHAMVAVGYPKNIKYEKYRGNGKRRLRRMLQQRFSYGRRIQYIIEECAERGVVAQGVLEAWTSKCCHRCRSMNTQRIGQSLFCCLNCGLQYNADWNSAINIGSVLLPAALNRTAREGLAHVGDELAYKPASPEVGDKIEPAMKLSGSLSNLL